MSKHTPGPWKSDDSRVRIAINSETEHIALANLDLGLEICKANANLIAAAPDLLQALKWLLEFVHYSEDDFPAHEYDAMKEDAIDGAQKAIIKSKGE